MSIEEVNKMSLEDIAAISNSHTQEAVLKRLMPSRRAELCILCEEKVLTYQAKVASTGQECASPRSFTGCFVDPYSQLKKYSHIYTVLAGWMNEEDLKVREGGILYAISGGAKK
jgi:hypothetical protein